MTIDKKSLQLVLANNYLFRQATKAFYAPKTDKSEIEDDTVLDVASGKVCIGFVSFDFSEVTGADFLHSLYPPAFLYKHNFVS